MSGLTLLVDGASFDEHDAGLYSTNPLEFSRLRRAAGHGITQKRDSSRKFLTGEAKIGGQPVAITISDFGVRGGTMGAVVGEKVTRNIEYATQNRLPLDHRLAEWWYANAGRHTITDADGENFSGLCETRRSGSPLYPP